MLREKPEDGMRRRLTVGAITLAVAGAGLGTAGVPAAPSETGTGFDPTADGESSVVEVHVADRDELDQLIATGVDLDHQLHEVADGLEVHAVVTPSEVDALEAMGFDTGAVVSSSAQMDAALEERAATIAEHIEDNQEFAA